MMRQFVRRWVGPDMKVSPVIAEIYALGGKKLTETQLDKVVEQTQPWLREKGQERWDIPGDLGSIENLKRLLGELWLAEQVLPEKKHFNKAVILGATYRSMKHRLEALLASGVTFYELVIITGERVVGANKVEVEMLTELGVFKEGMTEADAASALLDTHEGLHNIFCGANRRVCSTPDPAEGKRATTDDTVVTFAKEIIPPMSIVWVGHQPFFRQLLTVGRVLNDCLDKVYPHHTNFLAGPLLAIIEENPYAMVDALGRTLYELNKLPQSFFTD